MAALRFALIVTLGLVPLAFAQVRIDDRPKVQDSKPLTKEELKREEAEQLLRDARSLYGIAIFRQRHDKFLEAVSALEKAAALDPDSVEIRRALVPIYANIGREDQAMTLCRDILDRDPFDGEIAHQYSKLLKIDGKPAQAIPVLQKAVSAKNAADRPERLLFMLSDLCDLLEKQGDFAAEAKSQEAIIKTIAEKREDLLYGNGFTRLDLENSLARSYERLGRDRIQLKQLDQAVAAFRNSRDTLLKSEDPEARTRAVRINLNLSELASSQERWADALEALDAYLQYGPTEVEPYEKKVELLRKLGRERDIVPALKRYAAREEFHIGLQLLLAREMAKDPRTRREAESLYQTLLAKNIRADIYRGLFKLYEESFKANKRSDDMRKVLDLLDESEKVLKAKDGEVQADQREVAAERKRAMLSVLRTDPDLVSALMPCAQEDVKREKKREIDTWIVLGYLAARTRKLPEAEDFFRRCLASGPNKDNELNVYDGLITVLILQKKYEQTVSLCRDLLSGTKFGGIGVDGFLHSRIASALAELGRFDEALVHEEKAIKVSSDKNKLRFQIAKAHILAQAARYDEAVRECQSIVNEFTKQVDVLEVRYTLSNIYSLKGDHEKSEEQLRLILDVDPDAHLACNNLGYQMADRNINLDEAEKLIRRAIENYRSVAKEGGDDLDYATYLDSLGWVLFRKGKLDEAREWLEKATSLPDGVEVPELWDHLGDVYAKLHLAGKAKEAWNMSLKLYDTGGRRKSDSHRAEVVKKLKTVD
jgi:tetratricopeptide (TPR) repeat protein